MENLTIVKHEGVNVVDSREVAKMVEKRHDNLMRDIGKYIQILETSLNLRNSSNIGVSDFFIKSEYCARDNNRKYPCYLLTRKGCDIIADKLTGEKGVIFTATYVTKFEQMEKQIAQIRDSYMIEDPIERAEKWIEEQKAHKALVKEKDNTIHELEESKGFNAGQVTAAINKLKTRISTAKNLRNVRASQSDYIIGKAKIFETFKARTWESIPSYKFTDVMDFIDNLKI